MARGGWEEKKKKKKDTNVVIKWKLNIIVRILYGHSITLPGLGQNNTKLQLLKMTTTMECLEQFSKLNSSVLVHVKWMVD